ncbi:MAG TPA: KH domain-containing protein [Candidatus Eisenbacteria bacterium]|nr:KH domain-containing protein [Candidatus Eisenbacteria bacterium]
MRSLIEFCARQLVDHPEGVHVDEHDAGETTVLTLRVSPGDLGKVIGREGRTAQSMRLLLTAAASSQGRHATLEIAD